MTQNKAILQGQRVTLRDTGPGDVEARFALGNVPEIQAMFGADPSQVREITRDAAEAWVNSVTKDANAWIIETGGRLIGSIRLHSVNQLDARANIALGILDPDALGHGYGTEAMRLLAAHAFTEMKLHRLTCRVLAFNDAAIAAYRKVGFREEGRERESARIGQKWHDDVIMGLLPGDLEAAT